MSIFQKAYDAIKSWKTPDWLKYLLGLVEGILIDIGEMMLEDLRKSIIHASRQDWTNEQKLKYVFNRMRELGCSISDSALNLAIEVCVSELKKKGFI